MRGSWGAGGRRPIIGGGTTGAGIKSSFPTRLTRHSSKIKIVKISRWRSQSIRAQERETLWTALAAGPGSWPFPVSPVLLPALCFWHVPPSLGTNHPGCRWADHISQTSQQPFQIIRLLSNLPPHSSHTHLSLLSVEGKSSGFALTQARSGHTWTRHASSYHLQTSPSSAAWSSLLWHMDKRSPCLSFVLLSKPLQAGVSLPSSLTWGLKV